MIRSPIRRASLRREAHYRLLMLLGCALLAGCLLNPKETRVTADHAATFKRVGLVSLLAPRPNVSFLSTSAQESSFAQGVIDGWNPDRIVRERVGSRLRHKGLEVVMLETTDALRAAQGSGWTHPQADAVNALLYDIGAERSLDMIVVVYPQLSEDYVTKTNQNIHGYGIQQAFDTGPFAYASVYLQAVDLKRRFVAGKAEGRMSAALDASLWREQYSKRAKAVRIPAGDDARIVAALDELLGNALGVATQELGF